MIKNLARFDRGLVKGDAVITDEGYIRAHAVVTRTGVFNYQNPDGTIRRELRHPEDVWTEDSISSMELIPITNGHPQEKLVSAENAKRLAIGYTGETIRKDGDFILANLVITDKDGVEAVTKQDRKELSLGYTVDLEDEQGVYNGEPYDARQKNIRYNHLAIVEKARAGNEARIALDSQDAVEIITEVKTMAKRKIKIDEEEIMVEESTAAYFERLRDDLRNLEDEKRRVEEKLRDAEDEKRRVEDEIKMIRGKLERAEGERDSLRDQMEDVKKSSDINQDSAEFKQAVAERIKLYKVAEEHLGESKLTKLDSMSNLEIKKNIIQECRKTVNLDGKSQVYIEAMFDTILDDKSNKSVNTKNVSYNADSFGEIDVNPAEARNRMIEKMKNAHRGGK